MATLKRLIVFGILLFAALQSKSQQIQVLGGKNTRVVAQNQFQVDSLFVLPWRDTTFTPYKAGAMVYRNADQRFYYYSGSSWRPIFYGATVTETDPTVSAAIKNASASDTTRWGKIFVDSIKRSNDTVYYHVGSSRFFGFKDSVGQAATKVDSVKRKVGSDSVFYYRSGTQVFAYRDSIGTGEANTSSNIGSGGQVFQSKVGIDFRFRSLLSANTNLIIAQNTNDLTFTAKSFVDSVRKKAGTDSVFFYTNGVGSFAFRDSSIAGGEANTASNVGTGVGVFKTKSSVDLQFKSITTDTTIAATSNTNDIELKVDQTRISSVRRLQDTASALRSTINQFDTLYIKNQGSGTQLSYVDADTIKIKRIQAGTNFTITQNGDSSLTFSASGGGSTVVAKNGITKITDTIVAGGTLDRNTTYNGANTYNFNIENLKFFYLSGKFHDATFDSTVNIAGDTISIRPTTGLYISGRTIMNGTSGFLGLHRMTTTQRTSLTGLLAGAMVWDTDLGEVYRYNGSTWAAMGGGSTYSAGSGMTLTGTTFKIGGTYTENATSALTTAYYHDFTSGANTVMRVNGVNNNVSIGRVPFSTSTLLSLDGTGKSYNVVMTSASGATVNVIIEPSSKTTFQNFTSSNGAGADHQFTISGTRNPSSGSVGSATLFLQPNLVPSGTYNGTDAGLRVVGGSTLTRFRGIEANGYWEMTSAHALGLGSMTTTERNALLLHRAGSVVWNSSLGKIQYYDGSAWKSVQDAIASLPPKFTPIGSDPSGFTAIQGTVYTLADLTGTGNATITLPSASTYSGWEIVFWNNSSDATFKWSYAAAITLPDGTTRTTFADGTCDRLISNGSVWLKIN